MGEGSKTNNKKLLEYLQHLRFSILKNKDNAPDLFQDIPDTFDKLLNIISQRLARVPGLKIEAELEICLRMITHFFDMDKVTLFKVNSSENNQNINILASYTRPGLKMTIDKIHFNEFPEAFEILIDKNEHVFLDQEIAKLLQLDSKHPFAQIKTGYLIPIKTSNKVNYIFGSAILVDRTKIWKEEIVELQKDIALVMAHAIAIHQHEHELFTLEDNWKRKFNTIAEPLQTIKIEKDISNTTISEHWIFQAIIELGDSGSLTKEKILTRIGKTKEEFQQLFPDLKNSSGIERFKSDVINDIFKTLSKVLDHIEPILKNMPTEIGISETLDHLADYYYYLKALAKINTESKERSVKRITGIIHYRLENCVYIYLEKLFENRLIDAYEMDGIKDAIIANFYYQSIFTEQRRWITSLKRFPHNLSYLLNTKTV